MKDRPQKVEGFDSVIVVDGVPQVGPDRFEKLQSFITKIYSKFGEIVNEYYPKNENGQTKGWVNFSVHLGKYKLESYNFFKILF